MSYDTDRYNLSKLPGQSLAVIQCGVQICHPGHVAPKQFYKYYSIHFILEGKGVLVKDGISTPLCAGQGFLIPRNTGCSYIADEAEPWKYVYAIFRGADEETLVHNAGLDESNVIFHFPTDEETLHYIYSMHRVGKKNEALGYDVTGYFLLVMSRLIKQAQGVQKEQRGQHYVKRAKKYIEDHYNRSLPIDDLAKHVSLDRTYLYRLFMEYEGLSPSDYLLNTRLQAAARSLENDALTIREIAANTGFCNVSYFYKRFSQKYSVTPKQFRDNLKKG